MGWEYIVIFIIGLIVAFAMMPKPQDAQAAGLKDVQAPLAEEGIEIPVLFGTRELKGANVVWYGDFDAVPVKKSS